MTEEKLVLGTIPVSVVQGLVESCVEAMLDASGINVLDRLQVNRVLLRAQLMPIVIANLAIVQAMHSYPNAMGEPTQ